MKKGKEEEDVKDLEKEKQSGKAAQQKKVEKSSQEASTTTTTVTRKPPTKSRIKHVESQTREEYQAQLKADRARLQAGWQEWAKRRVAVRQRWIAEKGGREQDVDVEIIEAPSELKREKAVDRVVLDELDRIVQDENGMVVDARLRLPPEYQDASRDFVRIMEKEPELRKQVDDLIEVRIRISDIDPRALRSYRPLRRDLDPNEFNSLLLISEFLKELNVNETAFKRKVAG